MDKVLSVENLGTNLHDTLLGMVMSAGLMVKFVLIILFFFSIVSWAIIFSRILQEDGKGIEYIP